MEPEQLPELPPDVLMLIFEQLNMKSRLTASLVCHQWNQLMFTAKLIQRVRLTLDIRHISCLTAAIQRLEQSDRRYRNLKLVFHGSRQQSLTTLQELLKLMHALKNLEIVFYFYCFREKLNVVIHEALASRPSIESISITIRGKLVSCIGDIPSNLPPVTIDVDNDPLCFPSLTSLMIKRNPDVFSSRFYDFQQSFSSIVFYALPEPETIPNLRHLSINCETNEQLQLFSRLSEQLESVAVVSFDPYSRLIEPFLKLHLPQVKNLKLPHIRLPFFAELAQFITTLRRIETLELEKVLVDSEVIETIFESCSELKHLGLNVDSLTEGCLKRITRLEKLEKLSLLGKLSIGYQTYEDYFAGSMGQLTRMKALSLQSFCFTSSLFVAGLGQLMCNLKELCVHECRAKCNIIAPINAHLRQLEQLEYIKVTHGGAKPLWPPNLARVRFINCPWVTSDHLQKLIRQCHRLRHLNIYGCGTPENVMQEVVESVPAGCFVERTYSFVSSVNR